LRLFSVAIRDQQILNRFQQNIFKNKPIGSQIIGMHCFASKVYGEYSALAGVPQ